MKRTVFAGGTIITSDPNGRRTSAVAIERDRIVAVGDDALRLADGSAEKVDLAGKTLVPGFRDGHCHPVLGGAQLTGAPISGISDLNELLDVVRRYADQHPDREWIRGFGYLPAMLPNARGDATVLDGIVNDRPVWLTANDGHTGWVNSVALERAGIDANTPDPPHGEIVRRPDGSPTGALLESAQALIEAATPPVTHADRVAGGRGALELFRANGITWVQDAMAQPEDVEAFLDLASSDPTLPRAGIALHADPDHWQEQRPAFAAARQRARTARNGNRIKVETVKFFADGVIETGTAAVIEEYSDHPGYHGIANWTPEGLREAVLAFDGDGFQIHIHAIGDAGIRHALDAIEETITQHGHRDRRATIAHTQLVHPDDIRRFATLDVIANFEPIWAQLEPTMVELTIPRLGEKRSAWQYPIGALLKAGARVSFGSDWPVTSLNPMEGIAVAVTRQTSDGDPPGGWLPDQRIDLDTAIDLYTAAGAYQSFEEREVGRIAAGLRADLVLLGADLDRTDPLDLGAVPIERVWIDGARVEG
ncbi:MAG TPA: amidohydrolase [Acidimicrobiia bacterium]|nr:amidohydrolase [Acidimicrobiia bacterium]